MDPTGHPPHDQYPPLLGPPQNFNPGPNQPYQPAPIPQEHVQQGYYEPAPNPPQNAQPVPNHPFQSVHPQEHPPQQGYYAPQPGPPQNNNPGVNQTIGHSAPMQEHAYQQSSYAPPPQQTQQTSFPPPPPMPGLHNAGNMQHYDPSTFAQQGSYVPPPPPQRRPSPAFGDDDPSNPISYIRDPHKLVAYLVPFPVPHLPNVDPSTVPQRFLIYTPPPPPLAKPTEGSKEGKVHKVQRKWQEEVREAKTSTAKITSWKGAKGKATKGISWAIDRTTSSNLDFLGRFQDGHKSDTEDAHAHDGVIEGETTKKTVGVQEMVLVYPSTMKETPDQIREEFVNTMLRTKTKAQRDAIISTGLMPVAYGIDILATFVWPFGGLGEIDTVWAYSSIRGAKTARSVTKRLSSSSASGNNEQDKLHLQFTPSPRLETLRAYLAADCHKSDPKLFGSPGVAPTETQVLNAIGWSPSEKEKNWYVSLSVLQNQKLAIIWINELTKSVGRTSSGK
jgi:hypothetical protein